MGIFNEIEQIFIARGNEKYSTEGVTQMQHATQCAQLAREAGSSSSLVVAALLHDIGHIMSEEQLPAGLDENLDDKHEERAYDWLLEHFGKAVADPVRLHVVAKRYLCTKNPAYEKKLSPTSYKSYLDQGGRMSEEEVKAFEAEPFYKEALALRAWDDLAKDTEAEDLELADFRNEINSCLS